MQVEKSWAWEPETVTPDSGGTYGGDDPDAEYVRLRLEMDTLRKERDPRGVERLGFLKTRLDDVKQSYFFREKASEAQYRLERQRLHSEALQAKLHGLSDVTVVHPTPPGVVLPLMHLPPDLNTTETTKTNIDLFENDSDDESPGGLFESLQEIPATETTASDITVRLQSMEGPSHSSDRLPKVILQETITKKDKYAVTKYARIPSPSGILRASVTISWNGGRTQSWSMDDVGCPDITQAEQYISTVALHALTFPVLDGFAQGGSATGSTQTSFRRLPPAFRDLWDELEAKRKELDEATNRAAWGKLRAITRAKLELQPKVLWLGCYDGVYLTRCVVFREAPKGRGRREGRETLTRHPPSRAQ